MASFSSSRQLLVSPGRTESCASTRSDIASPRAPTLSPAARESRAYNRAGSFSCREGPQSFLLSPGSSASFGVDDLFDDLDACADQKTAKRTVVPYVHHAGARLADVGEDNMCCIIAVTAASNHNGGALDDCRGETCSLQTGPVRPPPTTSAIDGRNPLERDAPSNAPPCVAQSFDGLRAERSADVPVSSSVSSPSSARLVPRSRRPHSPARLSEDARRVLKSKRGAVRGSTGWPVPSASGRLCSVLTRANQARSCSPESGRAQSVGRSHPSPDTDSVGMTEGVVQKQTGRWGPGRAESTPMPTRPYSAAAGTATSNGTGSGHKLVRSQRKSTLVARARQRPAWV